MRPGSNSAALAAVAGLCLGMALGMTEARGETAAALCARAGTDDTLRPIDAAMVPRVNALFGTRMPARQAIDGTVFRCVDGRVMVCTIGANLPCGKANADRAPGPGVVEWCKVNPDAGFVPAFATGHDTIYAWRCRSGAPEITRRTSEVDARGFLARYWRELK